MADDKMLEEAIKAVAKGQRHRARDLLTRLLKTNQANPQYWLWMSSVVDSAKERSYCLKNVLRLDPGNRAAKLGLVLGGSLQPDEDFHPKPITPRNWESSYQEISEESGSKKVIRRIAYIGAGVLVLGLLLVGFLAPSLKTYGYFGGPQLTITPQFNTAAPTATLLPTNTPRVITPSPTFIGPTPLWMLLDETYTPTPLYVNTPHPISEAYRAGIRAFNSDNFEEMLTFMKQAAQAEPDSADTHFYIGEAYLHLKEAESALIAFEKAIETDPNFAPAHLGRARVLSTLNPEFDVKGDLLHAINLDPNLTNAYLDLIAYYIETEKFELALDYASIVEDLNPESALLYLYRSQALLNLEQYEQALEAAQLAYDKDRTILPLYFTLGLSHLQSGNPRRAKTFFEIYLRYVQDDPRAWEALGRTLFEQGDSYENAIEAFNAALELDENSFIALLYRGLTYLEVGEGQLAVNDLVLARNFDRESFEASLGLGQALFLAERIEDAISQFSGSESLADTDLQRARVYYWRAQAFNALGDRKAAVMDFQALIDVDSEDVSKDWIESAQEYIILSTPTPTRTSSPIPNTDTPTVPPPSLTPTYSTPTPTVTKSPTTTPRPSSTPFPRR
jgi:tetratricopeptide (TPR) repeat protein